METFAPAVSAINRPEAEEELSAPAGIDAAMVDAIDRGPTPLRQWPAAIADLYDAEVVRRLYREEHFLFLLGMMLGLATIAVDLLIHPEIAREGLILRIFAIVPVTVLGLIAGARGWTQLLAFCVGAAPIAFIAVIVHLAYQLPPDLVPRYLYSTALMVGLANLILPYSLRGLIIFDIAALSVKATVMALQGWDGFLDRVDFLVVFALIAGATLVVAARFENLRQHNFLLTLRARIASRELRMANRALRTLSESDPLTGIANRRGFEQAFEREIFAPGTNGRANDTIALMMIDLDHFKRFNDTHGHQAGDSCLQLVADALQEVFNKSGGIVGRYGGEEFIAALRHRDADAVRAIAEKARRTIAVALTPAEDMERSLITASIGVGMAPAAAMLPREELIEMADAALYTGKDSGRNRVEFVEAEAAFFKPN